MRSNNKILREICTLILHLVKLRDEGASIIIDQQTFRIKSVSFNNHELERVPIDINLLSNLSIEKLLALCNSIGFPKPSHKVKSCITINGKIFFIKSHHFTDFALKNHSVRPVYKSICDALNISIKPFDKIINEYWRKRHYKIINEDISTQAESSPFKNQKDYLKPILTKIAFTNPHDKNNKSIDYILDYENPTQFKTWHVYSPLNYIDKIWNHLCFSFRGDRGMPKEYDHHSTEYAEIKPWTHLVKNHYKGALHIRVKSFNSIQNKESSFIKKNKKEIQLLNFNRGERDEILIKIFFIIARMNGSLINCNGKKIKIDSVKTGDLECPDISFPCNNITDLSIPEIIAIKEECNIGKGESNAKADIKINNIGISLKSLRGAPPSIINHTPRKGFISIINRKNVVADIYSLDCVIEKYWKNRLTGKCKEDVKNTSESPFFNSLEMKEFIKYFSFKGTAKGLSPFPAHFVLFFNDPFKPTTWTLYGENNYVDFIWEKLIFSIRNKGLTDDILNTPWTKYIDNKNKGALSVRVKY